jgi:hypothetical protein
MISHTIPSASFLRCTIPGSHSSPVLCLSVSHFIVGSSTRDLWKYHPTENGHSRLRDRLSRSMSDISRSAFFFLPPL